METRGKENEGLRCLRALPLGLVLGAIGWVVLGVLGWWLFSGCAHQRGPAWFADGRASLQKAFACFDPAPGLDVTISVPVTVRIVGERHLMDWDRARQDARVLGYADPATGRITVFGRRHGALIVVDPMVLGHEVNHLLQFAFPALVANPDTLYPAR